MDRKLTWVFALLLTMLVTSMAVQYFVFGDFNPAYLFGTLLGTLIAGFFLPRPPKAWVSRVGAAIWVLFVPVGVVGIVRLVASLFSIQLSIPGMAAIYLLGAVGMTFICFRSTHFRLGELPERPILDERYLRHFGVSGYWAYLFLNALIVTALLQPWVPRSQIELWVGVLAAGLVFWVANLFILEHKS
ncbi:MAG: hypothetical protein GYA17_17910 [Chloroflexi bacterium]|nr:hypothetical protein [Chloroflexota bacterium]